MAIPNRFSAILLYCDSTQFCASRCGISGDSWPAILGIGRCAIRNSVPLRGGQFARTVPKSVYENLSYWGRCCLEWVSHRVLQGAAQIGTHFWEGDATKHFSVKKKGVFSEKGGGNSVNGGFGKDFYRKGNSVKRFRPFTEPPDSEN